MSAPDARRPRDEQRLSTQPSPVVTPGRGRVLHCLRTPRRRGREQKQVPMLTLYGDLDSGNVYKVRLLLAQLGVTYRRVDTTQNRGEPRDRGIPRDQPDRQDPDARIR